ncbi:MAG: hypothetical protein ABI867_05670 [Kofleriaceae bacterium]
MKSLLGVLIGAVIAVIVVACGGAPTKSAPPRTPASMDAGVMSSGPQSARERIDQLDKQIDRAFAKWSEPRPPIGEMTPTVASTNVQVKPTADPECKPGASETCSDTCKLGDSICDNANEICKIAGELGDDAYANGKCTSGRASCEKARQRCCGCL